MSAWEPGLVDGTAEPAEVTTPKPLPAFYREDFSITDDDFHLISWVLTQHRPFQKQTRQEEGVPWDEIQPLRHLSR